MRLQCRCFPVKFTKFLRRPFCVEQLKWLLLKFNSCFQVGPRQKPMRLSLIYIRFSWKRYLLPQKSRSSCHRFVLQMKAYNFIKKRLHYCEIFKNIYLEKHLRTAASENQHQIFRRYISFLTFKYPKFCNEGTVFSCNMFCQGFFVIVEKL